MVRVLMVATVLFIAGNLPTIDAGKTETEKLEGIWTIVSEDSFRKGEKWIVKHGQIREGERDTVYRFYRCDPRKMPKVIDIIIMAQPDGQVLTVRKGIYSLKGDEWKLFLADGGKERPGAFPRNPSPGRVLVLKRQKP
jgi:uncharacterized protein (TIGR03067 family)